MNNLTLFSVTAPSETALKKLQKANIPVYNCRKSNSLFLFYAHNKYVKKVLAIFSHPCYNVNVVKQDSKTGFFNFVKNRVGVFIGIALFLFMAVFSNSLVLKIKIEGSGSYLSSEVKNIIYSQGIKEYSYLKKLDEPALVSQILSLPNVTFCSVQKEGGILTVFVNAQTEQSATPQYTSLKSDVNGKIIRIVALCGTPLKQEGDEVAAGDILIGAYILSGEQKTDCLVAGYCKIECKACIDYFATECSEREELNAIKSAALYADEITEKSVSVKKSGEGFIYTVNFTYIKTLTVNLNED